MRVIDVVGTTDSCNFWFVATLGDIGLVSHRVRSSRYVEHTFDMSFNLVESGEI